MSGFVKILGPQFSTFVRSVMIACEEKGISYEYGMEHNGKPVALASEELLSLHPYGKIPVLLTEDAVICETASIIRYLDMNFSGTHLQPDAGLARAEVDQWSALISRYIDQAIVRDCLLEFARPKGENGTVRMDKVEQATPELQRALDNLSKQLGDKEYLCGEASVWRIFFCCRCWIIWPDRLLAV